MSTSNLLERYTASGLDLGSSSCKVALASMSINPSSPSSNTEPCFTITANVVANNLGERSTPALVVSEVVIRDEVVDEEGNVTVNDRREEETVYVVGESAKKSLIRSQASIQNKGNVLTANSITTAIANPANPKNPNHKPSQVFFRNMKELAVESSGLGNSKADRLRIVLSVPNTATVEEIGVILDVAAKGFNAKKSIMGVISTASAICVAHGITGSHLGAQISEANAKVNESWKSGLVVQWGSSGMEVSVIKRVGLSDIIEVGESFESGDGDGVKGDEVIETLMKHCATQFMRKNKLDLFSSGKAVGRLRSACETAVLALSRSSTCNVEADGIMEGMDLSIPVSKPRFDMMCGDFVAGGQKIIDLASTSVGGVDKVDFVLKGGAVFEMSVCKDMVSKVFPNAWHGVTNIAVGESVVLGCAIQCALLIEAELMKDGKTDWGKTTREIDVVTGIKIGVCKLTEAGAVDGQVTLVIDDGTPLGTEIVRTVDGVDENGAVGVVDVNAGNKVVCKIGECKEGGVKVGIKVEKKGGLTVRCGGVELSL